MSLNVLETMCVFSYTPSPFQQLVTVHQTEGEFAPSYTACLKVAEGLRIRSGIKYDFYTRRNLTEKTREKVFFTSDILPNSLSGELGN